MSKMRAFIGPVVLAGSVAFCAAFGEMLTRLLFKERLQSMKDERSLAYRYDKTLGWFPRESSEMTFTGYRTVSVRHNRYGFRDHEYDAKERPRLIFVGDSFVWGFDVEQEERFTHCLQELIPDWEVLNLGVSGYGTDQQFLLLQQWCDTLQPDIVFLVYTAGSDDVDNIKSLHFGGYFKPFYTVDDQGALTLHGVPVPKGAYYRFRDYPVLFSSYLVRGFARGFDIVRNWARHVDSANPTIYILQAINRFLEARNVQLAIGFHGYAKEPFGPIERNFCDHYQIPCLDLKNERVYPSVGNHWTPVGHEVVARKIHNFLQME